MFCFAVEMIAYLGRALDDPDEAGDAFPHVPDAWPRVIDQQHDLHGLGGWFDGEHAAHGAVFLDLDFLRRQIGRSNALVVCDGDIDVARNAFTDGDRCRVLRGGKTRRAQQD